VYWSLARGQAGRKTQLDLEELRIAGDDEEGA
jgi:hypothetical protein